MVCPQAQSAGWAGTKPAVSPRYAGISIFEEKLVQFLEIIYKVLTHG